MFRQKRLHYCVPQIKPVLLLYRLLGFKADFNRPVNRFLGGFRSNRLDHRVPEVDAVQNIYRFMGFVGVRNLPVFDL